MKKLILFLLTFVFLMQLASAAVVVSYFTDNNQQEIEIVEGHSTNFRVYAGAARNLDLRVWIENDEADEIHEIFSAQDFNDGAANGNMNVFDRVFTIDYDMYNDMGDYTIHVFANDDFDPDSAILDLSVLQNNAPEVRVIHPNGGEVLSGMSEIRWNAQDPDDDILTITIEYSNNNGQSWNNLFNNLQNDGAEQFNTRNLPNGNQYLIRVNANDMINIATDNSDNTFTIRNNNAPTIELINPSNNEINVPINVQLVWEGSDLNNDRLTYDVFLNNNRIANDINQVTYDLRNLNFNTVYSWYVIVSDGNQEVRSETWNFRTIAEVAEENHAPTILLISPSDNGRNIPINIELIWEGHDIDNDVLTYDVYFEGQLIANDHGNQEIDLPQLQYNTVYSWYVIANDGEFSVRSPTWIFTTVEEQRLNMPPTVEIISPMQNSIIKDLHNIRWNGEDDHRIVRTVIYYRSINGIPLIGPLFDIFNNYQVLVTLEGNPEIYTLNTKEFRNGRYDFKVQVFDIQNANGDDEVRTKIMNIVPANFPPRITSEPITNTKVNTQYLYDVDAVDPEGDRISYSLIRFPEGMAINAATGLITWNPNLIGNYEVEVRARDVFNNFAVQRYTLTVSTDGKIQEKKNINHEFNVDNIIVDYDDLNINVYVKIYNTGNQDEKVQLMATNMETGDITYDSFLLDNGDGYWRIMHLPKPSISGVYTIAVFGNNKDYNDVLYRDVMI